jgi:hypothetical protein
MGVPSAETLQVRVRQTGRCRKSGSLQLLDGSKDIKEDLLDRIFCLRFIAKDTSRDSEKA